MNVGPINRIDCGTSGFAETKFGRRRHSQRVGGDWRQRRRLVAFLHAELRLTSAARLRPLWVRQRLALLVRLSGVEHATRRDRRTADWGTSPGQRVSTRG